MTFFNDNAANFIQHISLLLEMLGFFLTYVELFKKEWVIAFESRVKKVHEKVSLKKRARLGFIKFTTLAAPLLILVIARPESFTIQIIIGAIILGLIYFYDFVVVSMTLLIDFLNRLTNGRVAGSVGLLLVSLGMLGEVYQVLNIYF
ncbi:MAG: hypothetical protein AAGG59_05945 [Bacteroidota bacterium]